MKTASRTTIAQDEVRRIESTAGAKLNLVYISRAVLVDGDTQVSYAVEMNDDVWTKNCSGVYDRNLVELTKVAKEFFESER
jgi:hypothetical protein